MTEKSYGQVAFEANGEAWPPKEMYVAWEKLSETAKRGWEIIAQSVVTEVNKRNGS